MSCTVYLEAVGEDVSVLIPDGWAQVWRGPVKFGDRYINCAQLVIGRHEWRDVTPEDVEEDTADVYGCLIRRFA